MVGFLKTSEQKLSFYSYMKNGPEPLFCLLTRPYFNCKVVTQVLLPSKVAISPLP